MTNKQRVEKLAAELGAKIIERRAAFLPKEVCIEAPPNKMWAERVHELIHSVPSHMSITPLWTDALERMSCGLVDCPDPECDWCHPEVS